ncbi:MAG TPA: N-formylglutamate amidohydrolase [Dongiaceae bacterium]|nr:N-formylglutamate amidohydrolase [Dongiaceae bacterium]
MSGDFNASSDAPAKPAEMIWPPRLSSPLLLASPHSGRDYPAGFLAQSVLDRAILRQSEDCYVDLLIEPATRLGVPSLRALFPRIFVDPNRDAAELDPQLFADPLPPQAQITSPRVLAGLGVVPRVAADDRAIYAAQLPYREALERLDRYYRPYHRSLQAAIKHIRGQFGQCLLLDCHSMPSAGAPLLHDSAEKARSGAGVGNGASGSPKPRESRSGGEVDFILGDCYGGACADAVTSHAEAFLLQAGATVRRNNPYSGGYVTQTYGRPAEGVHVLQLEINRRLYVDEASLAPNAGFAVTRDLLSGLIGSLRDAAADLIKRR